MKANIPTAIRRKISGRSLLREVSGVHAINGEEMRTRELSEGAEGVLGQLSDPT